VKVESSSWVGTRVNCFANASTARGTTSPRERKQRVDNDDRCGDEPKEAGIALITSVANLGGFIGPYLLGFITRRTGNVQSGMLVAGISLLVSSLLASRLPRRLTA
jgi:nitrate/nitrite transporter NarK